jgi:hypothetical protein
MKDKEGRRRKKKGNKQRERTKRYRLKERTI